MKHLLILSVYFLALVLAGCSTSDTGSSPPGEQPSRAGLLPRIDTLPADSLRVATLNMTIGFPVEQLAFMDLSRDSLVFAQTKALYDEYLASLPIDRVRIMAAEIARLHPDVVGLQEVLRMERNGVLHSDFLPLLIREIENAGGPRYAARMHRMNRFALGPFHHLGDSLLVIFAEGNAVLVRDSFTIVDSANVKYTNNVRATLLGMDTAVERGFNYVKIQSPRGKLYQVFNTHIEVEGYLNMWTRLQKAQVSELAYYANSISDSLAAQVLLGDLNGEPSDGHLSILRSHNWLDCHAQELFDNSGTCCVDTLTKAQPGFSNGRIDYVLGRGITAVADGELGLTSFGVSSTGLPLWGADHRLVFSIIETQ